MLEISLKILFIFVVVYITLFIITFTLDKVHKYILLRNRTRELENKGVIKPKKEYIPNKPKKGKYNSVLGIWEIDK